ncbi:MAG: ComF family protein [Candidatus Paceibacterota bacterium]
MKRGKTIFKNILDIILPKTCVGCGRIKTFLCEDCFSLIEINPYRYCFCRLPKRLIGKIETCSSCPSGHLNRIYSASYYNGEIIKKVINELKYHFQIKEICLPLVALILTHLKIIDFKFTEEMIVIPVPIHKSREKWRGFNQSKEIAKIIAEKTDLPYYPDNLIKIKKTKAQVGLKRKERLNNLKNCFSIVDSSKIKNKTVLLIDDVYTTGATMEECAKILKEAGAKNVYGITATREILT